MRYVIKLAVVLVLAAVFSTVFSPVQTAAFRDALLDFLDGETVNKVLDYLRRTELSRALGMTMILVIWTGVVIAIDRLVDSVLPGLTKRITTQGPV